MRNLDTRVTGNKSSDRTFLFVLSTPCILPQSRGTNRNSSFLNLCDPDRWKYKLFLQLCIMKRRILVLVFLVGMGLLLSAGCTQNQPVSPTPTPTQASTATPTSTPLTRPTSGMGIPGPTQTLPPTYSMDFQITTNGDTANPMTQVSIRGGNGLNFNSQVDVNLTTLEGKVSQKSMYPPFSMGQNVVFPCSQYENRVEIWVTAPQVGKIKTNDEIVPFKQLNP